MHHGEPLGPTARRGRAATALIALAACLALVAMGCSSSTDDAASSGTTVEPTGTTLEPDGPVATGGQLVVAVPAETPGWNPAFSQWADAGNLVASAFMEPLMEYQADGTNEPFLAESVEPVDGTDFSVWRITVKPDIRFHDGSALDASAVARSLSFTYADPASLTSVATKDIFVGAEPIDDRTVEVTWSIGYSSFPSSLAGPAGVMMAPAMLDSEGYGATEPIGTGPFRFERWERDDFLEVSRNDDYWQDGVPNLDSIRFEVYKDATTRRQALESGDVDLMLTHTARDVDELEGTDNTVIRDYESEKTFVLLNAGAPPFDNEHARKALAYATDREALIARLGEGIPLGDTPTVANTFWALDDEDADYVDHDLAKAQEEVAAYKEETGAETLTFRFAGVATLEEQQLQEMLQSQWAEAGIDVEIETLDQTAYVASIALGGYEAAYWRSYSYLDPDTNYVFWHESTIGEPGTLGLNFSRWSTPEISTALEAARLTDNPDARKAAYDEIIRLRNQAAIDIWLFNSPTAIVARPDVRGLNGFRTTPFANYLPKPFLNDIWLDR